MPSTYTTNLGVEKIATGEQSGTWGDTTNTNFDLLDSAIDGVISINLSSTGSSGSPNSLPITDGTASNGRNKFIEFSDGGDLGGTAYVQLTPNNAEKVVHIRNSLSGSRSILIFQGTYNASNDFEIPAGKDVVLKFDGGGTGATVTQVFVNLLATAFTGPVTGAVTGNVTGNVTGDVTGNLTGNVTGDVTGNLTGNVTGNITSTGSSSFSSIDVNGGNVDGTPIGATSASTGQFTTLTATGTATFATVDINGGDIDGTNIGATTEGTGAFSSMSTSGTATLATVDINAGAIDNTTIGATTAAAATVTDLTASGTATFADVTATGTTTVTTADINGGAIDGTNIGATTPGTGVFSALTTSGDSITIQTTQTPANASATGTTGEIAWDANYIYVCIATDTWKRVAIDTWS